jgi:hypothetical protein
MLLPECFEIYTFINPESIGKVSLMFQGNAHGRGCGPRMTA